jgi:kynureninase
VILTDIHSFPTDLYAAESVADLLNGRRVRRAEAGAIAGAIDKDTACVVLTHLDYRSGRIHDMNCVTRWAHAAGAMMLWDVAHSAGALPVDLGQAGSEFAVGCGYKQRDKVT